MNLRMPVNSRLCLVAVLASASAVVIQPGTAADPVARPRSSWEASQTVCGPLCVRFILQGYGLEADLLALVQEVQGDAEQQGATLSALKRSLETRRLKTLAVQTVPSELNWDGPAILHAESQRFPDGHYVVLLPADEHGKRKVWDRGDIVIQREFAGELTGAALLVAPPETETSASAGQPWTLSAIAGALACVAFFLSQLWLTARPTAAGSFRP